jgi:hypothetical protein
MSLKSYRDPITRCKIYTLAGYGWTLEQLSRASSCTEGAMRARICRWTEAEILQGTNQHAINQQVVKKEYQRIPSRQVGGVCYYHMRGQDWKIITLVERTGYRILPAAMRHRLETMTASEVLDEVEAYYMQTADYREGRYFKPGQLDRLTPADIAALRAFAAANGSEWRDVLREAWTLGAIETDAADERHAERLLSMRTRLGIAWLADSDLAKLLEL